MNGRLAVLVTLVALAAVALLGGPLLRDRGGSGDAASPYVSQQASPIRGLSPQEVEDLLQGRGAGFARTAELNGYPGPRHVLDLADPLGLEPRQRAVAESLFAAMGAAARELGREILEREQRLSAAFASHTVSAGELRATAESLGVLYGRLRAVHLAAHVELTQHLTSEQIHRYDALRGYDAHTPTADSGTHVHD